MRIFSTKFSRPCKRVNCEQCMTVMGLKNHTSRVKQFIAHLDNPYTFDAFVVVPFNSLPRFRTYAHNEDKEITQVEEYLLLDASDPQLSFDELSWAVMDPTHQREYQERPFSTIHSNATMYINSYSQWSALRIASIRSKCLMKACVFTSIQGGKEGCPWYLGKEEMIINKKEGVLIIFAWPLTLHHLFAWLLDWLLLKIRQANLRRLFLCIWLCHGIRFYTVYAMYPTRAYKWKDSPFYIEPLCSEDSLLSRSLFA